MKNYVNPNMTISKFNVERVSATNTTPLPTIDVLLSIADYGTQITNTIEKTQNAVSANVSFQDAIKFR